MLFSCFAVLRSIKLAPVIFAISFLLAYMHAHRRVCVAVAGLPNFSR